METEYTREQHCQIIRNAISLLKNSGLKIGKDIVDPINIQRTDGINIISSDISKITSNTYEKPSFEKTLLISEFIQSLLIVKEFTLNDNFEFEKNKRKVFVQNRYDDLLGFYNVIALDEDGCSFLVSNLEIRTNNESILYFSYGGDPDPYKSDINIEILGNNKLHFSIHSDTFPISAIAYIGNKRYPEIIRAVYWSTKESNEQPLIAPIILERIGEKVDKLIPSRFISLAELKRPIIGEYLIRKSGIFDFEPQLNFSIEDLKKGTK